MSSKAQEKRESRIRRHTRLRKKVFGAAIRPRLAVYRSLEHIYAQVINDEQGHTVASASTVDGEIKKAIAGKTKTQEAQIVGQFIAKRAKAAGISQVVFDRGGNRYQGRIKALADAAREAGLDF
jgi:large subunit ribosomal protein L18